MNINIKATLFGMFSALILIVAFLLVGMLGTSIGMLQWEQLGPASGLFQKGVCAFAAFYGGYISGRLLAKNFIIRGFMIGLFTVGLGTLTQYISRIDHIDPKSFAPAILSAIAGAYIGNIKLNE